MSGDKRHESWGSIQIAHVYGKQRLFRSALEAHSSVTLRIHRASLTERGDVWNEEPIVEVRLSPVQFAELITQPNRGSGVACTLVYLDGKRVSDPPVEQDDLHAHVEESVQHGVFESAKVLEGLIAQVSERVSAGKPLGVRELRELLVDLKLAHMRSSVDLRYWRAEMQRRADLMRVKIAADMHATADLIVRNMGLGALAEKARAMLPSFPQEGEE